MAILNEKEVTVMVFGVFDLLHPGHLFFLSEAKKLGTRIIVVVTRDVRVKSQKGHDPVMNEQERLLLISALHMVDRATLGDGDTPIVITRFKPDVIAVGHDQDENHPMLLAQLEYLAVKPVIIKLAPYNRDQYRSSRYKEKIL